MRFAWQDRLGTTHVVVGTSGVCRAAGSRVRRYGSGRLEFATGLLVRFRHVLFLQHRQPNVGVLFLA